MRSSLSTPSILPVVLLCSFAGIAAAQGMQQPTPVVPTWFEPMPVAGEFHARAGGGVAYRIAADRWCASAGDDRVAVALVGARPTAGLVAAADAPGISNYYFGRDPAHWRTAVPHHSRLVAHGVRPGIDLVWRSAGRDVEFDLVARSGADLAALRLRVEGARARSLHLLADGAVLLPLGGGELRLQPPCVYQERGGTRTPVACRYRVDGADIAFDLGAHDPELDVVVDPVVTFSTLVGGNDTDTGIGCAFDNLGNMVVTGSTASTAGFPLLNPLLGAISGVQTYVTKFDAQGALVFSTYFGGTSLQGTTPVGIGCDPQGRVVFGGNTYSATLPTTPGVVQPIINSSSNWFFTALLPSGALAWCTYYNGGGPMKALHVLDVIGGSVIGVGTGSLPFVMTNGYSTVGNIAVAGVFGGNVLWVSTQCGFSGTPTAIDVTANGHICVTGTTGGVGLPTTASSFQSTPPGWIDGFVFVFFGTANSLVFCTYFGGTGSDAPKCIRAVSGPGTVHCTIAGDTNSIDMPVQNAVQPQRSGGQDAFVARLNGNMTGLDFSTYFGGSNGESVTGLAVDAAGNTFVGGYTNSLDVPLRNSLRTPYTGVNTDGFVAKLSPGGAPLVWSTTIGGANNDFQSSLALGPGDAVLVTGNSGRPFPVTPNALPSATNNEAFLVRLADGTFESYGTSTAGYWGAVPTLAGGGSAQIGGTAMFDVHDGRSQAFGLLGVGSGRTQIPFLNGFLWTVPTATVGIQLGGLTGSVGLEAGGGVLHLSIAIPPNPTLVGALTDWQAAFLDPAAVGSISLTNGVELIVQ